MLLIIIVAPVLITKLMKHGRNIKPLVINGKIVNPQIQITQSIWTQHQYFQVSNHLWIILVSVIDKKNNKF